MCLPVTHEGSVPLHEMIAVLGIDSPQLDLLYGAALRRCEGCPSKETCREWLNHASGSASFAPPLAAFGPSALYSAVRSKMLGMQLGMMKAQLCVASHMRLGAPGLCFFT